MVAGIQREPWNIFLVDKGLWQIIWSFVLACYIRDPKTMPSFNDSLEKQMWLIKYSYTCL